MTEHPAVTLHGSLDHAEAAAWWYERAMESAREANALRAELAAAQRRRGLRGLVGRRRR
jgi:hypothetical protein